MGTHGLLLFVFSMNSMFLNKVWADSDRSLPKFYENFLPASEQQRLNYIEVKINDEYKKVVNEKNLPLVKGDLLSVEYAFLQNGKKILNHLNVIGYTGAGNQGGFNDAGKIIDTGNEELNKRWLVDGKYKIIVADHKRRLIYGSVTLEIVEPKLEYIEAKINHDPVVLRQGNYTLIGEKDLFKVENVVTNLSSDKKVTFKIEKKWQTKENLKLSAYYIIFSYGTHTFAKVPLIVQ